MKIKLMVSGLLVTLFCSTYLVAQEGPSVLRTWNCSVNNGFTMSEVAFARNIDWSEDVARQLDFFAKR